MVEDSEPEDLPSERPQREGVGPEERSWLDEQYPLVDADFVPNTLDMVLSDRSRIADEAARVDDIRIDREFLASYTVPAPSRDFVERTLSRVMAERAAGLPDRDDEDLRELLGASQPPAPHHDFVERTLHAVMAVHPAMARRVRHHGRIRRLVPWAAAAAILATLALGWWPTRAAPTPNGPYLDTPVAFARLIHEASTARQGLSVSLLQPDDLTDFVAALEPGRR